MSITKDGFYKQSGTNIGDNNYVLLGKGGSIKYGNDANSIPLSNSQLNIGLNADMVDGKHLNEMLTYFTGGQISSSGNTLTQTHTYITIGGTTYYTNYSTANIVNSLSVSKLTSNAEHNLTIGITVNGVASVDKTLDITYCTYTTRLLNPRKLLVNLSTTAVDYFDGVRDATNIGVSGTLPTTYGGTGNTGFTASRLIYSSSATKLSSGNIVSDGNYISNLTYLSINHAHQTNYRLWVEGGIYSSSGFYKGGSDNTYVLLGGGGHTLVSSLIVKNADTVDNYHANGLFETFTGGGISSSGNTLTQANYTIKIGGTSKSAGSSTASIINSHTVNGGALSSSANTMSLSAHGATINGISASTTASSATIINSLSISTLTSNSTTNLTAGITINGKASGNATITDLYARYTTQLLNARTITIGATGRSFNGTANISWTIQNIFGTSAIGGTSKPIYYNGTNFVAISDTVGTATKPIYLNAGTLTAGSYELKATVNNGTANRIAWYNGANSITSGSIVTDGGYLGSVSYLSVNTAHQTSYRLRVNGDTGIYGTVSIYPNKNTTSSTTWTWPGGGYYATLYPNIRLIGDNDHGISTIEFVSQKLDTTINKPSDCAFIQFNPYGISAQSAVASQPTLATSGEINRLIIGVSNDANDQLWLQTPAADGLRHIVGTANYRILTTVNTYVSSNKGYINGTEITQVNNSDTLDGLHGNQYVPRQYNNRFYPFIKGDDSKSIWHKVTLPWAGYTSGSNAWMMTSMELVLGGAYSNNNMGRIYLQYYFSKNSSNVWSVGQVQGITIGNRISDNGVTIKYDLANPGIFYVKVNNNVYNSFAIENISANDTAPSFDFRNTTIAAIAEGDIPSTATGTVPLYHTITTQNGYWANLPIQLASSNTTVPSFGAIRMNGATSAGTNYITGSAGRIYFGGNFHIDSLGNNATYINHYTANNVYMVSGSSQGKVGIGNASPSYKLHVTGDIYTTGWARAASGFYCHDTGVHYTHKSTSGEINITSSSKFLISGNSSTMNINSEAVSRGTLTTLYIWNAGSSTTYAGHTAGYLNLFPGSRSSYGEGIRLHTASNGWTTFAFCGTDNTSDSGTSANTWSMHTNGGNFYLNKNNSNGATVNRLWARTGGGFTFGNTANASYVIESAGDIRTATGWFRSTGNYGWYNDTYGGGIYMTDSTYVRVYNSKAFYVANSTYYAINTAGGLYGKMFSLNTERYILKPWGANFVTTTSSYTGAITITLPASIGNSMISMWIDVYNYSTNTSFSVHVGGYTYSNSTWQHNPFAMVYGANHTVRLGHNGTSFIIYIGETNSTWAYPQITVRDVILGFSPSFGNWANQWTIGFSTSFSNVTATITNYAFTTKNTAKPNIATANRIAWYNGTNSITSSSIVTDGGYLGSVSYLSVNTGHQTSYRAYINGNSLLAGTTYFGSTSYWINNGGVGYFIDWRSARIRLVDNWIGFYTSNNAGGNRLGYIQTDGSYMYFRKENGNAGFNFNGNLVPSSNLAANIGTNGLSWNRTFSRYMDTKHLDATAEYTGDMNLYIGYGAATPTQNIYFYYSTGNRNAGATSRTHYATINVNGMYAHPRFGVNGQNNSYNLYVNGSADFTNRLVIDTTGRAYPYSTSTRRAGMYGVYDSTKIGHIWSMGTSYMIADDGANFGNLYGLAYKHTNNSTGGTMAGGHQAVWCDNGSARAAMGYNGFWAAGGFYKNGSNDNYFLLGGGGHKALSDFALSGHNHDTAYVKRGGDSVSGHYQFTGRVFGYNYGNQGSNAAAFMWDKPGSYYTGMGPNGVSNQIHFGPCNGDGTWVSGFNQQWDFQGNIYCVNAYATSDARKKYDIRDIFNKDITDLFDTDNGYIRHFKWKNNNQNAYGFIAQEIIEYCPEAVELNNESGFYSVNYNIALSKIVGAMFKKIKMQEQTIKSQNNDIEELRKEILELKKMIK